MPGVLEVFHPLELPDPPEPPRFMQLPPKAPMIAKKATIKMTGNSSLGRQPAEGVPLEPPPEMLPGACWPAEPPRGKPVPDAFPDVP